MVGALRNPSSHYSVTGALEITGVPEVLVYVIARQVQCHGSFYSMYVIILGMLCKSGEGGGSCRGMKSVIGSGENIIPCDGHNDDEFEWELESVDSCWVDSWITGLGFSKPGCHGSSIEMIGEFRACSR